MGTDPVKTLKAGVQALRSGKYNQIFGTIFHKKCGKRFHCAYGVLTEVVFGSPLSGENTLEARAKAHAFLEKNGPFTDLYVFSVNLNDNHRLSFSEIADEIEKEYNLLPEPASLWSRAKAFVMGRLQ